MPVVTILPAGRRSCAENYARRAWSSAQGRRPNNLLRTLGDLLPLLDSPRPVYGRMAREAMKSGDAVRMLDAIKLVCAEIERRRTELAKCHEALPKLYPQAA